MSLLMYIAHCIIFISASSDLAKLLAVTETLLCIVLLKVVVFVLRTD